METIATALSDETAAVAMVQLDANGHRFQHQMDTAEGTAPESSVIQPVQPIEKRPMQVNPSSEPKLLSQWTVHQAVKGSDGPNVARLAECWKLANVQVEDPSATRYSPDFSTEEQIRWRNAVRDARPSGIAAIGLGKKLQKKINDKKPAQKLEIERKLRADPFCFDFATLRAWTPSQPEVDPPLCPFDFGTCLRWYPAVPSDAAVVPDVGPTVTATAATRVEKGGATAAQSDESIWADERELSRACQEAEAGERKRRRDWERNHRNGQHPCTDALPHSFTPAVPPTPPPMQPLGVAAALSSVGCMPPPADIFSSWLATLDSPPPSPESQSAERGMPPFFEQQHSCRCVLGLYLLYSLYSLYLL